jgi:DNA-binding CsgD family transcriptional regulator
MTENTLALIATVTAARSEPELLAAMLAVALEVGFEHVRYGFELHLPNLAPLQHFIGECAQPIEGYGISFPVYEGHRVMGMLSLVRDRPFRSGHEAGVLLTAGSVLARCVHVTAANIIRPAVLASCRPRLSPRERECLQLFAMGKSNWDIGRLLDISEETAAFHVKNVLRKLGVSRRVQAVAIGVALGLVS